MNNEYKLYAALAAFGGMVGIMVALRDPVAGFLLISGTVIFSIIGTTINLKKELWAGLPNFNKNLIERKNLLKWGSLTIPLMVLYLVPELVLVMALAFIAFALIELYIDHEETGNLTEENWMNFTYKMGIFGILILTYSYQVLLLLPAVASFTAFLYYLLPQNQQKELKQRFM